MSLVSIFSAPKPFEVPHIRVIQRNAVQSWAALGEEVEVILMGNEPGIEQTATEFGLRHIADIQCNADGTPLISDLFLRAHTDTSSPILAYVNADILLMDSFLTAIKTVKERYPKFLLVGQRWDMDITEEIDFTSNWQLSLETQRKESGVLYPPNGSDYFIFPRSVFEQIPQFAVGRAGWDNWMIYHAAKAHWPAIDATHDIQAIHQNHDYRHLPGGKPHYRNQESQVNVQMAGGRRNMYLLIDTNKILVNGQVRRHASVFVRLLRWMERLFLSNRPDEQPKMEAVRQRIYQLRTRVESKNGQVKP